MYKPMAFAHQLKFHHQSQPSNLPKKNPSPRPIPALIIPSNLPYNIYKLNHHLLFTASKRKTMSGLRLLTRTRCVAGTAALRPSTARLFTTTAPVKKTATETAKETVQKANKTAGEAGVAAIEKGRTSFISLHIPLPHTQCQCPFHPTLLPFIHPFTLALTLSQPSSLPSPLPLSIITAEPQSNIPLPSLQNKQPKPSNPP